MLDAFKRNVVFVAGASSKICIHIALELVKNGASLFLVDEQIENLHQIAVTLKSRGAEVEICEADAHNFIEISAAVNQCIEKFGRVDTLLVGPEKTAPLSALSTFTTPEALCEKASHHLDGIRNSINVVTPLLKASRGRVVLLASAKCELYNPYSKLTSSHSTSFDSFCKSLGIQLKPLHVSVTKVLLPEYRQERALFSSQRRLQSILAKATKNSNRVPESRDAKLILKAAASRQKELTISIQDQLLLLAKKHLPRATSFMLVRGSEPKMDTKRTQKPYASN